MTLVIVTITVITVAILWLIGSLERSRAAQAEYDELRAKYDTLKISYDSLASKYLALMREKEDFPASCEAGLPNEDVSI